MKKRRLKDNSHWPCLHISPGSSESTSDPHWWATRRRAEYPSLPSAKEMRHMPPVLLVMRLLVLACVRWGVARLAGHVAWQRQLARGSHEVDLRLLQNVWNAITIPVHARHHEVRPSVVVHVDPSYGYWRRCTDRLRNTDGWTFAHHVHPTATWHRGGGGTTGDLRYGCRRSRMSHHLRRLVWVCLPVRTDARGDLGENLLQPHLVSWEPFHVIEGLHIDKLVRAQSRKRVQSIIPCVREVSRDRSGDLVALEKVHDLVPFPLEVRVHVPNRRETMEVFWIVLAKEVDDEVNTVRGLAFLDLLRKPREKLRYRRHRAVSWTSRVASLAIWLNLPPSGLVARWRHA